MTNPARKDETVEWQEAHKLKQRRKAQRQSSGEKLSTTGRTADLKAQRDQALDATFGMLKGKGVLPEDALQFERELREE